MAVGMSLDLMDRGQILQIHQKVGAISRAQIGTEARRPLCLSSPRYEYISYPPTPRCFDHPLCIDPSLFSPLTNFLAPTVHRYLRASCHTQGLASFY